jgi:hypothetical protein
MIAEGRWPVPLAAADSFRHMGQRFQRHSFAWQPTELALLVGLVALAALGVWLLSRYLRDRERIGFNNTHALFAELCRAHHLDRSARRLLSQWARSLQLSTPARLFVEPHHFQAEPADDHLRVRKEEVHALRDRIFGGPWCEKNLDEGRRTKSEV